MAGLNQKYNLLDLSSYSIEPIVLDPTLLVSGTPEENLQSLIKKLEGLEPGLYVLPLHLAKDSPEMRACYNYRREPGEVARMRAIQLQMITAPEFMQFIERNNIHLISYSDLPGLG